MKFSVVKITPNKAAIYLKNNPKNRKVKPLHVAHLAEQMTNGEWKDNGQTIVISDIGSIVDGQHRLLAIIESGVTLSLPVCTGVAEEVIHSIDTGKSRTIANVFELEGHDYTVQKASFSKYLIQWKKKTYHYQTGGNAKTASLDELYQGFMKNEKNAIAAIKLWVQKSELHFICRGEFSFAYYLLKKKHKGAVDEFVNFICEGGDYKKSPSHFISNYLPKRKRSIEKRHRKEDFYVFMYCFEEWLQGHEMDKIDLKELIKNASVYYANYKI